MQSGTLCVLPGRSLWFLCQRWAEGPLGSVFYRKSPSLSFSGVGFTKSALELASDVYLLAWQASRVGVGGYPTRQLAGRASATLIGGIPNTPVVCHLFPWRKPGYLSTPLSVPLSQGSGPPLSHSCANPCLFPNSFSIPALEPFSHFLDQWLWLRARTKASNCVLLVSSSWVLQVPIPSQAPLSSGHSLIYKPDASPFSSLHQVPSFQVKWLWTQNSFT